jgi:sRNA-binding carbon storage regulator CsrA
VLVLNRWEGETVVLSPGTPQETRITVIDVDKRGRVRIGIEADRDAVPIYRGELLPLVPANEPPVESEGGEA